MGFRTNKHVTTEVMFDEMREFLTKAAGLINLSQASVGNGVLSDYSATGTVVEETFQLTATTAGVGAVFTVIGGTTGAKADATSDVPYTTGDGTLSFTITDGATPWEIGDVLTFETKLFMGADTPWEHPSETDEFIRTITSSKGLVYTATNNGLRKVDGRYPDTVGIQFERHDTGAVRYDIAQQQAGYPEMSAGNGYPRQFTLSLWADETSGEFDYNWQALTGIQYRLSGNPSYCMEADINMRVLRSAITYGGTAFGINMMLSPTTFGQVSFYPYTATNFWPRRFSWMPSSYMPSARLTSVAYPWNLYCIVVDTVGNSITYMINGVIVGTTSDPEDYIAQRWPSIYEIGSHVGGAAINTKVDEIVVWTGLMDETTGAELYNRSVSVQSSTTLGAGALTVWEKVTDLVVHDIGGGYFYNTAENGQRISLSFSAGQKALSLSAAIATTDEPTSPEKQFETSQRSNNAPYCCRYVTATDSADYHKPLLPSNREVSHLLRGLQEDVEAYWIIADTNRIILLTKYLDTSTPKKTPQYLLSYLGQLDNLGDNGPAVVVAGNYSGETDWFSSEDSIRFGGTYGVSTYAKRTDDYANYRYWNDLNNFVAYHWEDGWKYYDYISDYGTNHGNIYPVDDYYQTWDIVLGGPDGKASTGDPDDTGLKASNYGRFSGVLSVAATSINAGDLLNIAGVDYIVIQDGNRTDTASLFAVKLA